jgi:hypothetical protein
VKGRQQKLLSVCPLIWTKARDRELKKAEPCCRPCCSKRLEVYYRTSEDNRRCPQILTEAGKFGRSAKKSVDAVAASLILETYLNKKHCFTNLSSL